MSTTVDNEEKAVLITHFINPYQFWYCSTDEEYYVHVRDLEEKLTKFYKMSYGGQLRSDADVCVGDEIVSKYLPRNKYVRVRIEEICRTMGNATNLIVWSIDHGYPFETKLEYCRVLPEEYKTKIDRVRYGGIKDIVPSSFEFDFIKQENKVSILKKWTPRACKALSSIIEEAASIEFVESNYKSGQYWGDLIVYDHCGNILRASDYLVNEKVALRNSASFRRFLTNPQGYMMPTWVTNDGNNNYKRNHLQEVLPYDESRNCKSRVDENQFQNAERKVAAWWEWNAAKKSDLDNSLETALSPNSALYDEVDDSVSQLGRRGANKLKTKTKSKVADFELSTDPTEQHPMLDDSVSQLKTKTKPKVADFELSTDPTEQHPILDDSVSQLKTKTKPKVADFELSTDPTEQHPMLDDSVSQLERRDAAMNADKLKTKTKPKIADFELGEDSTEQQQQPMLQQHSAADYSSQASKNKEDLRSEVSATPSVRINRSEQLKLLREKRNKETLVTKTNEQRENVATAPPQRVEAGSVTSSNISFHTMQPSLAAHVTKTLPVNDNGSDVENSIANSRMRRLEQLRKLRCRRQNDEEEEEEEKNVNAMSKQMSEVSVKSTSTRSTKAKKDDTPIYPAGFNLDNLQVYKDKDHWHRRPTTRNETNPEQNQDFRFTRANIDKRKENENPAQIAQQKEQPKMPDQRQMLKTVKRKLDEPPTYKVDKFVDKSSPTPAKPNEKVFPTLKPPEIPSQNQLRKSNEKMPNIVDEFANSSKSKTSFVDGLGKATDRKQEILTKFRSLKNDEINAGECDVKNSLATSKPVEKIFPTLKPPEIRSQPDLVYEFDNSSKSKTSFEVGLGKATENSQISSKPVEKIFPTLEPPKIPCQDDVVKFTEGKQKSAETFEAKTNDLVDDSDDFDDNCSNASSHTSMYSAKSELSNFFNKNERKLNEATTTAPPGMELLQNCIKPRASNNQQANNENSATQPATKAQQTLSSSTKTATVAAQKRLLVPSLGIEKEFSRRFMDHRVLAHAAIELTPIESFNKIPLADEVREHMLKRGFSKVSGTQAYAWPHLLKGNSAFIVNSRESCKTWCYIPPLCTLVIDCFKRQLVPDTYGPLAIVLTVSSEHAINVADACSYLLRSQEQIEAKAICSYGVRELQQTRICLMEGYAILVATPANLRRLFAEQLNRKEPLFNAKRLRHIIIDDIDAMLLRCKDDFESVLKSLRTLAPKLNQNENINEKLKTQLVVTSRTYLPIFKEIIKIAHQPLLLMGDFLEATFYGKAKICFEYCAKSQKIAKILEFIEAHPYTSESLMILCNNDEELYFICEELQEAGIAVFGCHSDVNMLEEVQKWKSFSLNRLSKVLVCTDNLLFEYQIQNVQNLIHYSLSREWTTMKFRFSVHKETYANLIRNEEVNGLAAANTCKHAMSYILLDEDNNYELPRIVECLRAHDQLKHISKDVVKLSQHICMEREKERCSQLENQFCDLFFGYGECDRFACTKRHTLNENDFAKNDNTTPLLQRGEIRMLVLEVFTPTHFAVRVLKHRKDSESAWHSVEQSKHVEAFLNKFNSFYTTAENLIRHWPVRVSDICVLRRNESLNRVRVLSVPKIKTENIVKNIDVTVKLLDTGVVLTDRSDNLFVCHEEFKNFPPQAINVRVLGLLPLDNETTWDPDARMYVKNQLIYKLKPNESVYASVSFSLVDNIAVRNVYVLEKLPTLNTFNFNYNLKSDLTKKQYAIIDKNAETKMFEIIKEFGFEHFLNESAEVEEEEAAVVENGKGSGEEDKEDKEDVPENEQTKLFEGCKIQEVEIKETSTEQAIEPATNDDSVSIPLPNTRKCTGTIRHEFLRKLRQKLKRKTPAVEQIQATENAKVEEPELPKVCNFIELLQTFRNVIALDAEEAQNEDNEEWLELTRKEDLIIRSLMIQEIERQNGKQQAETKAIMAADDAENVDDIVYEHDDDDDNHDEVKEDEVNEIEDDADEVELNVPPLRNLHKRPKTTWYQTKFLIIISIEAPNILDYELQVEPDFLYYAGKNFNRNEGKKGDVDNEAVNDVDEVLILNFLGCIEPQFTSHELRGLQVIVRLQKSIFMEWPRLVKQEEKMPWLSYNLNTLNVDEMDQILPQQFIDRVLHTESKYNSNAGDNLNDSDSDESDVALETYVPIVNEEDKHDPMYAERF